jgi:hypothetical protein
VEAWSADTTIAAFKSGAALFVFIGNSSDQTLIVPWSFKGLIDTDKNYCIRAFNSEYKGWLEAGERRGKDLLNLATPVEQQGFHILRFDIAPEDGSRSEA